MLYFILWVAVIVGSILAFVLTIVMNQPKREKTIGSLDSSSDEESSEQEPLEDEGVVEDGMVEEVGGEVPLQAEAEVADDFAAFDDEFK